MRGQGREGEGSRGYQEPQGTPERPRDPATLRQECGVQAEHSVSSVPGEALPLCLCW